MSRVVEVEEFQRTVPYSRIGQTIEEKKYYVKCCNQMTFS